MRSSEKAEEQFESGEQFLRAKEKIRNGNNRAEQF